MASVAMGMETQYLFKSKPEASGGLVIESSLGMSFGQALFSR